MTIRISHYYNHVNPPWGDIKTNTQMRHDTKEKKEIIHRLQIAKGHLEKVISMAEKDEYCINIVHQSIAIQAALKKVDEVILENHLKTCVADSIRHGETNKVVKEVMEVFEKK